MSFTNNKDMILDGTTLHGDDFTDKEIAEWFADEEKAYYNLYRAVQDNYDYVYTELDRRHAYRHLKEKHYKNVLGIGSAYGGELEPILSFSQNINIVEADERFYGKTINGHAVKYVKPHYSGVLPFEDGIFDLVVCFSVLHHIPNVTAVLREVNRCMKPGGYALIREPIHSMGDWRRDRPGLSKRERGLPFTVFRGILTDLRFEIINTSFCMFPLIKKLGDVTGFRVFNNKLTVMLDYIVSKLPFWPLKYHPTSLMDRFSPGAVVFVVRKRLDE